MSKRTSIFEDLGSIGERLKEIQRQEERQLPATPAEPAQHAPPPPTPPEEGWYGEFC